MDSGRRFLVPGTARNREPDDRSAVAPRYLIAGPTGSRIEARVRRPDSADQFREPFNHISLRLTRGDHRGRRPAAAVRFGTIRAPERPETERARFERLSSARIEATCRSGHVSCYAGDWLDQCTTGQPHAEGSPRVGKIAADDADPVGWGCRSGWCGVAGAAHRRRGMNDGRRRYIPEPAASQWRQISTADPDIRFKGTRRVGKWVLDGARLEERT